MHSASLENFWLGLEEHVAAKDVGGSVEVGKVWERVSEAWLLNPHPFCDRHHHGLPRVFWDEPAPPCILVIALQEGCGEVIEHMATVDITPEHEVVPGPRVVGPGTVRSERTTEVRCRHHRDGLE